MTTASTSESKDSDISTTNSGGPPSPPSPPTRTSTNPKITIPRPWKKIGGQWIRHHHNEAKKGPSTTTSVPQSTEISDNSRTESSNNKRNYFINTDWWKKKIPTTASKFVDGCFDGSSSVHLPNGTAKPIKNIQKGDVVLCNTSGATATVKCVLIIHGSTGRKPMVSFENGLVITPMHPILWDGEWVLPGEVVPEKEIGVEKVFNFVLEGEDSVVVNGIICSVMGTTISRKDIAHPFWGNKEKVVQCMKGVSAGGFDRGVVQIAGLLRNERGTVYGFRP